MQRMSLAEYKRMEDIKKELELDWSDISYVVNQDDVKWLINRVEELELEINDWRAEVQKWQKFYKESEESHLETKELLHSTISEIKRYKQALEFYADEENYKPIDGISLSSYQNKIDEDGGQTARKALEGLVHECK